jgi:hypothetical protein
VANLALRTAGAACCMAGVLVLAGCAHSYVDAAGNRHVVGWAHITLPPASGTENIGAHSMRVRSAGLTLLASPERTHLTLGLADDTLVVVRNNACVAMKDPFRREP